MELIMWLVGIAITIYWMVLGYQAVAQLMSIAGDVRLIRHAQESMRPRRPGDDNWPPPHSAG